MVRRDSVWFAVHAARPAGVRDVRYDFGVLALKFRRGKRWVDVPPPRPTDPGGPFDGGGPALVTPDGLAFPHGTDFAVDPQSGEVVVNGGYRIRAAVGRCAGSGSASSRPPRGVRISAPAPAGSVLRFQDFLPQKFTAAAELGRALSTPTATSRLSETPSTLEYGLTYASADALDLLGVPALRHRARRRAGHVDARRTAAALASGDLELDGLRAGLLEALAALRISQVDAPAAGLERLRDGRRTLRALPATRWIVFQTSRPFEFVHPLLEDHERLAAQLRSACAPSARSPVPVTSTVVAFELLVCQRSRGVRLGQALGPS